MSQRLLMFGGCLLAAASMAQVPIVYSRCPRSNTPVTVSAQVLKAGVTSTKSATVQSGDLVEALPDTSKEFAGFVAPCDLIYRDADGGERTLFDCTNADGGCAALDPAVSFDAKTIAFSVFRGPLEHFYAAVYPQELDPAAENTGANFPLLPGTYLASVEAQLYLVDVATGALTPLAHAPGVFDFGPVWLANGRLGFTTDRTNTYRAMPTCLNTTNKAVQYSSMALDGKDVERPNAHGLASELHPIPLVDGRVLISSWQLFGMLSFGHGNAVGSCGTLANKFHLYAFDPDGSRQMAVYGQHLDDPTSLEYADKAIVTHMAAHFIGQSSDRRIWVDEYYRDNNLGLGTITGFALPPEGEEGITVAQAEALKTSAYRPPRQVRLAGWASNADQDAAPMPAPSFVSPNYADPLWYAGKVGHPAAAPGNRLLVTWGKGSCSQATGSTFIAVMRALAAKAPDNPVCDTGIYLTPPLPEQNSGILYSHPSQWQAVVDRREFHEFFARAVVPYRELYGVDSPELRPPAAASGRSAPELPSATPFGMLGASSILHRETNPHGGFLFEGDNQMSHVGTDTVDYTDSELCGIRILAVLPNRRREFTELSFSTVGERVGIIGEFAVRKGGGVIDGLGKPDTSFRVRLPADVPYLMQGIDCEGRTLNTDQTWQHLSPGEFRTCNGCHVHSAASNDLPFATTVAGKGQVSATLLGEGTVPLLQGGPSDSPQVERVAGWLYQVEFERDIMPLLASRCVSCHGAARAEAGLRLDIARTDQMQLGTAPDISTWKRLANDYGMSFVPAELKHPARQGVLAKPNLSKYVRMLNARGSLLYWKAANQRTDGRTDQQVPSNADSGIANYGQYDVDFGPSHITAMTAVELRLLSRWIDTGAGWGSTFMEDTIAPTLSFVGTTDAGVITGLLVGTTDVGSGIVPSSLRVCVLRADAGCLPVSAPLAAMAGVVSVALEPGVSRTDDEIEVAVGDDAGNTTRLRRSARFLLGLPTAIVEAPDAGSISSDGGEPVSRDAGGAGALEDARDAGPRGAGDVAGRCGCTGSGGSSGLFIVALLVLLGRRRLGLRFLK